MANIYNAILIERFRFFPFTDYDGNMTLGGVDVVLYLVDGSRVGFHLYHTVTLMQQSGGHASYDRHQCHVSEEDFTLHD